MRHEAVRFRLYFDKDKEEFWINGMSEKGYALEHFFLGFYFFSKCLPGEYIYRIDLIGSRREDAGEYIKLAEDTGAEYMGRWVFWYFFRRSSSKGEFKLYTDTQSLIEHYTKIFRFFLLVLTVELILTGYEFGLAFYHYRIEDNVLDLQIFFVIISSFVVAGIARICVRFHNKIRKLKQENI